MDRLVAGDTAPAFALPDWSGTAVSLSDFAGSRVVVYFYPAAMTPGCTREAIDFRDAAGDFAAQGLQIIGISPDPVAKIARFRAESGLDDIVLLSDPGKDVLRAYAAYGSKMLYGKSVEGVIRSTFLVDVAADGTGAIALAQYNVRATGHVARLRREFGLDAIAG
ncbi:peroxiredoxin [Propionicicella superfundia]|uniref:peroxiredoxin n=1 Tax=Propionicicella superfundia TaxID=348582 RepID=UPI0003F6CDE0|nr:peroxiredoxin [Propionicicella superfundia]